MKQGWEIKKLGDVLTIERGGSPRPIDKYLTNSPDGFNWIKISDATASDKYIFETKEKITKEGLHKTRMVNEGDFILSNSMSFGRPYIMKTSGCIHDGWLVLKENGQKIFDTEFLYYLLSSPYVFNQFDYLAAGSTVRNLNIALVSSVEVPIPPLPEQQRIVSILDEAFAAIAKAKANAEQNLKNAKELFESYLQGVFEKKGDGWESKKLGEVCETGAGGTPLKTHKDYYEGGTIPWLLSGEVSQGEIFEAKNFITDKGLKNSSAKMFPPNTVLVAMYGATAGQVGILRFEASTNQAVCGILPNEKYLPEFIYYKFLAGKDELVSQAVGGAQPNISQIKIKNTLVPLISIKQQQTIVRQLDALRAETQKLEAVYQKKIADLEELKKSILQKAFAGELKTSQEVV